MSIHLRGIDSRLRPYAEYALSIARDYGINPVITSTFRSWAEQVRLRDRYERGLSRFPANRPGDSAHNFGWAWDSVVPPHQQDDWDAIRRYVGWEVLPNDRIHAQLPNWRDYRTSSFARPS